MCIAILTPKGKTIDREILLNCWVNNFNGAGFMYNDNNGKMHVVKEMDSFKRFNKKYQKIRAKFPDSTMVLHFRISTHGVVNKTNCHPFKVNPDLGFVHNGIISGVTDDVKYSDTNMFNREILKNIPGLNIEMLDSIGMDMLMGSFIGYSKLVFMDTDNKFAIINEEKGHWAHGIWYSNDSYKEIKSTVDYGGKTVSRESLTSTTPPAKSGGSEHGYKSYDDYLDSRYSFDGSLRGKAGYKPGNIIPLNKMSSSIDNIKKASDLMSHHSEIYSISDGIQPCKSCGNYSLEGELMSFDGFCLECVTQEESATVCSEAVKDGATLKTYTPGTVVVAEVEETLNLAFGGDELTNEDLADAHVTTYEACDYCCDTYDVTCLTHVSSWEANLCKGCETMLVHEQYLDKNLNPLIDEDDLSA